MKVYTWVPIFHICCCNISKVNPMAEDPLLIFDFIWVVGVGGGGPQLHD